MFSFLSYDCATAYKGGTEPQHANQVSPAPLAPANQTHSLPLPRVYKSLVSHKIKGQHAALLYDTISLLIYSGGGRASLYCRNSPLNSRGLAGSLLDLQELDDCWGRKYPAPRILYPPSGLLGQHLTWPTFEPTGPQPPQFCVSAASQSDMGFCSAMLRQHLNQGALILWYHYRLLELPNFYCL